MIMQKLTQIDSTLGTVSTDKTEYQDVVRVFFEVGGN